jgi:predicted transport protein
MARDYISGWRIAMGRGKLFDAMPKSPKEMGEAIARNLPEKTGRTFDEWVEAARTSGLRTCKERIAWLKSKHGLGSVTAMFIAAESEGRSIVGEYSDEGALLDGMYGGEKVALRPLYEELAKTAKRLGKDVRLTVCKTYVGMSRARQFAMIRPSTKSRVDVGLVLHGIAPAGRLAQAGSIGNDRMTHRIEITTKKEIDGELKEWLRRAYDAAV